MNRGRREQPLERYRRHAERGATPRRRRVELSERELSVLTGIADGLTDGEIGSAVGISEFTVKTHLRRVYAKLAARNRAHAVARALAAGVLTA